MKVSDFDYDLPSDFIARYPTETRTDSKLLVFDRSDGTISHRHFHSLEEYLDEAHALIVNNSRVFKARLIGHKDVTGGEVEFLCLHAVSDRTWKVLSRPARRIKSGTKIHFGKYGYAVVVEVLDGAERIVEFSDDPLVICENAGQLPLPPYIKRQAEESDLQRYQTVYSDPVGSVAAPTAGLHFTDELLDAIRQKGVEIVKLTLHIGWGTFRPVAVEDVKDHCVEQEWYSIDRQTADALRRLRENGKSFVVIGTTTTRALESWWRDTSGKLEPASGWTDLFIYPPYRFNLVDKLVTNFHLPKSSLLMLVSAFASRESILECYRKAVDGHYRFYSYGDAMLIL